MLKPCHRKRELLFMNLDGQRRSASYREVDSRINIPKVKWASWCDGRTPIAGGIPAVTTQHLHEKTLGGWRRHWFPVAELLHTFQPFPKLHDSVCESVNEYPELAYENPVFQRLPLEKLPLRAMCMFTFESFCILYHINLTIVHAFFCYLFFAV